MIKRKLWMVETENGDYDIFDRISDARAFAEGFIRNEIAGGAGVTDEDIELCIKELNDSYEGADVDGFYVDEILWCYKVNYHTERG